MLDFDTIGDLKIAKSEGADKHQVFGVVYSPNIPDSDGEYMTATDIEKMAHDFLIAKKLDKIDVQHNNNLNPGASIIESFIARKGDPDFSEGSWVVGVYIPDEGTWQSIKKGEINGFSLEALVTKTPMTLELDIPPVVNGITTKSEDHEHDFFVTFDADGKFMGGRTSIEKGHFHNIRAGTMTEAEQGHNHRFSFVEQAYKTPKQMESVIKAAADCGVYPMGIKPVAATVADVSAIPDRELNASSEVPSELVEKGGPGSGRKGHTTADGGASAGGATGGNAQREGAVNAVGSVLHEKWRSEYQKSKGDVPRVKPNGDGTSSDINVPFDKLHPAHAKENLEAGRAAFDAVQKHPNDMESAAEHVHNEWMARPANAKCDYNAAQHVPYSQLPEPEKQKDRDHVDLMNAHLKGTAVKSEHDLVEKGGVGSGRKSISGHAVPWVVHNEDTGEVHSVHSSYGKATKRMDALNLDHFHHPDTVADKNGMVAGKYGAMAKDRWDSQNKPA